MTIEHQCDTRYKLSRLSTNLFFTFFDDFLFVSFYRNGFFNFLNVLATPNLLTFWNININSSSKNIKVSFIHVNIV